MASAQPPACSSESSHKMRVRSLRSGVACRVSALALACGSAFAPVAAWAQDVPAAQIETVEETRSIDEIVEWMIQQGKVEQVADMLEALDASTDGNEQVRFLRGLVAMRQGEHRKAIAIFRSILVNHPQAVRVRLELARAFFTVKDYQNADRQFRAVRAGNLPPAVQANIDAYLAQIRMSKDWSYSVSVALAPDTNINGASTSREVDIYGLPFRLSDDARQKSGVGAAIDASVEYALRIAPNGRLRLGAALQRHEYGGTQFDDMTLALQAGPRFVFPKWDVSLLGTGSRRWYGGEAYASSLGSRIEATHYIGPRTVLNGTVGIMHIEDERDDDRSRWIYSASLGAVRQLSQTSLVTLRLGANRQNAAENAYSNWSGVISAGYYRELPAGFSVYLEPSFSFTGYDAPLLAFGKARSDKVGTLTAAVLNRRIVFWRFSPRLAYSYTRANSNIDLYDYNRHRVEIGVTTVF